MAVAVEIHDLENIVYSEYFLTGLHVLKEKKEIDSLSIGYRSGLGPGRWQRLKREIGNRIGLPIRYSKGWAHMTGTLHDGASSVRFAVNFIDTPWHFDEELLVSSDVYFKCQYPKTFKDGYVRLARNVAIPISPEVMRHAHKVRPLIAGRPLSKVHDFKKNRQILADYEKMRFTCPRRDPILIYFGMSFDDREIEGVHHPHLKRALLVAWAHRNIPGAKIVFKPSAQPRFAPCVTDEIKALATRRPITDSCYWELMRNAMSSLNITGIDGSVPFRVIDSLLSGMVLISDEMACDWYEPLLPGTDYLSVGDLGYERMEDIDFDASCRKIREYAGTAEQFFASTIQQRNERFHRYYSPEAVARYLLGECRKAAARG